MELVFQFYIRSAINMHTPSYVQLFAAYEGRLNCNARGQRKERAADEHFSTVGSDSPHGPWNVMMMKTMIKLQAWH